MNEQTHTLELPGLREDILRDHLATLGMLDWMVSVFSDHNPMLSWSTETGHPVVHTSHSLPEDWANQLLIAIQGWRSRDPNPLGHGKIEATNPAMIRTILLAEEDPRLIRFYCGITSQLAFEKSGRRSELIIESASRSTLKGVNDLLDGSRNPICLDADLSGRGQKREVSNTSRWHPAEYQPAAYVATDPQFNKHQDWVGLNVLALFGTAFYPVIDTGKGRQTIGFRRIGRTTEFSWPAWKSPLGLEEVRALTGHPVCHQDEPDRATLSRLGIHRLWRTRKFKPDGNNDYFSTARIA